jgi:hypothetical protein
LTLIVILNIKIIECRHAIASTYANKAGIPFYIGVDTAFMLRAVIHDRVKSKNVPHCTKTRIQISSTTAIRLRHPRSEYDPPSCLSPNVLDWQSGRPDLTMFSMGHDSATRDDRSFRNRRPYL